MKKKNCPTCGGDIRVYRDDEPGDEVCCDDCEREFILLSYNPLRLEVAEEYEDYYFEEDELEAFR